MKILLIHQYAGNKGDRAVLHTTCRLLHELYPTAQICVSTSHPELWMGEAAFYDSLNTSFIPSAWDYERHSSFLLKLLRPLKKYSFTLLREMFLAGLRKLPRILVNPAFRKCAASADVICSVGGHHFTTLLSRDIVSSINFDAAAACLYPAVKIALPQSFGPFEFYNQRNAKLTHEILNSFRWLFVREKSSLLELEQLALNKKRIAEVPETVLALNRWSGEYVVPSHRNMTVGGSIYATARRDSIERENYISVMAGFCDFVMSKGYTIRFFPMEMKNTEPDDRPMIRDICGLLHAENYEIIDNDMVADEHIREIANCRVFVGHKTHSTIFALAAGTPLLGIAYHPKTSEFLNQYERPCDVVSDDKISVAVLSEMFENIEKQLDDIGISHYRRSQNIAGVVTEAFRILHH